MAIELITSTVTVSELKDIARNEAAITDEPKALYIRDIHVADRAFQPRRVEYNMLASQEHLKELVSALRVQGNALKSLVVVPIGNRFFLIDGHHRLSSYAAFGWTKKVPVTVLRVSVDDAIRRSIEFNSKNKLPMSRGDKADSAWKLVKAGCWSKSQITESTGVTSNLDNMRRVLRGLRAAGVDVDELSWDQARKKHMGIPDGFDREAYIDEKAIEVRDKLLKHMPVKLLNNPEAFAKGLSMVSEQLPSALIAEWHEHAIEYVRDHQEALEADGLDI